MPDLTVAPTVSNSQQEGVPENRQKKKWTYLDFVGIVSMIVLGFVLGPVLSVLTLVMSIFIGGVSDRLLELLASVPSDLLNILPDISVSKGTYALPLFIIIPVMGFFPLALYFAVRFRYKYILILDIAVVFVLLITSVWVEFGNLVHEAKHIREDNLKKFGNAQMIKAYLPTKLKGEWHIADNEIDSSGGVVKVNMAQMHLQHNKTFNYCYKDITMVEIVSPNTDLKCDNETLLELNKMVTTDFPISDKRWLTNCEELSISGEKAILSGYDGQVTYAYDYRTNPYTKIGSYRKKEFLMIFDKGSTRIYLDYIQSLEDYLMSTENWSKNDLIRVAENLRPINSKDFKL